MDADRHRLVDAEDDVDGAAGAGRDDLSASIAYDPLERVCWQLNFEHSLVVDADELRRRVVIVLDHVAATRMRNIAIFERCAANGSGERARRLRALAAASRLHRDTARRQAARVEGLPIDEPRPSPA